MRARLAIIVLIVITIALTGCAGSSDTNADYTQITQEEFNEGHILGAICIPEIRSSYSTAPIPGITPCWDMWI